MQITNETSVVGWTNTIKDAISRGIGSSRDIKANYAAEIALAERPADLVERVNMLLLSGSMSNTLRDRLTQAVESVPISTRNASSTLASHENRVYLAIYLAMVSPEYLVLK